MHDEHYPSIGEGGGGGRALQMDKWIIRIEAVIGKQEHNIWSKA